MNKMILVRSSGDWGDEFDLEGFAIFSSEEDWEKYKAGIPDVETECYYGSNEFVTFDDRDDYLSHLVVVKTDDNIEIQTLMLLLALDFKYYTRYITYGLFISNSSYDNIDFVKLQERRDYDSKNKLLNLQNTTL